MPILRSRCLKCHTGANAASDLRMDNSIHFLMGLERNKLITKCDKNKSEFFRRLVQHDEVDKMMPLNRSPLSSWELKVIGNWIDNSCQFPKDLYRELNHWTFEPISAPDIDKNFKGNPIDFFLGTEKVQLAESKQIQQRIHLSLTGMYSNGFKKVSTSSFIKETQQKISYGERMASYWLRLHRFADTVGGDRDSYRLGSYRYRDYLIKSFNRDSGIDEIIFNQLAGDQVRLRRKEDRAAIGVHLVGEIDPEELESSIMETKLTYVDDILGTVFSVNLGLDMRCAKCHDHRSNPLTQKQYYQLAVPFHSVKNENFSYENFEADEEHMIEIAKKYKEKKPDLYKKKMREVFESRRALTLETIEDMESEFIRVKGEAYRLGDKVTFELPDFYKGAETDLNFWRRKLKKEKGLITAKKSQRAILGEWMINNEKGVGLLTARNMVNHLWSLFFGRSLIDKPSDQNFSTKEPDDIKLLNYLAIYLVKNNWSFKKLSHLILSSKAFQARSVGGERLKVGTYDYFKPVPKFSGEVRDQVLQISGLLNEKAYGPGIQVKLKEYFENQVIAGNWMPVYEKSDEYRKSIYLLKKRSLITPQLLFLGERPKSTSLFGSDKPRLKNEVFYFLGSGVVEEASNQFAQKLLKNSQRGEDLYKKVFVSILGREPTLDESESIKTFEKRSKDKKVKKEDALAGFCQSILSLNELRYIF